MLGRRGALLSLLVVPVSAVDLRLGYFLEAQPFQAACTHGWFDLPEYNVSCQIQSNGGQAAAALDDGDLHLAVLGTTPWAAALSRGVDVKLIYTIHRKGSSQGLVTRRSISDPTELSARRIATVYGSTAHYQMLFIIQLFFGTSRSEPPTLVFLSPSRIVPAWNEGSIDGAFCWGTAYATLREEGSLMFPAEELGGWGKPTFNILAADASFAAAHPDAVRHVVDVMSALDAAYLDPLQWSSDFTASVTEALVRNASRPDVLSLVNFELSEFVFLRRSAQLACEFLGHASCASRRGLAIASQETAAFMSEQKLTTYLTPQGRWWPTSVSDEAIQSYFDQRVDETFLASATNLTSLLSDLLSRSAAASPTTTLSTELSTCADFVFLGPGNAGHTTGSVTDGAGGAHDTSYSDGLYCVWVVAAASPSDLVEVTLRVMRIWAGDRIRLYSGTTTSAPVLAHLHGFHLETIAFRAVGAITIELTTDFNTERSFNTRVGDGFLADYDAAAVGCSSDAQCGGGGACAGGICHCADGRSGASCANEWCTGRTTLSTRTGSVRSSPRALLEGERYQNDAYCEFVVRRANAAYVRFSIAFDTEKGSDYVREQRLQHADACSQLAIVR